MKYYILINQQVLSETELDIIDGGILDYIYFYCNSQNEKIKKERIIDEKEVWTWINYQTLLRDMPMLHFKSIGIITLRINKIEKAGFIKTKRFKHQKKYFRMTAKSDGLFIQMNRAIQSDEQLNSSNKAKAIQSDEPIKYIKIKDINEPKKGSPTHSEITELFDYYKQGFLDNISNEAPFFNWGICEKNARPLIKKFGLERMKRFVDYYLKPTQKNDKEWFKKAKWSLPCFLSVNTLHNISVIIK